MGFLKVRSITSLSVTEVLDDISESIITGPVLWSTYSPRLKAPGKSEDLTLAVNPG